MLRLQTPTTAYYLLLLYLYLIIILLSTHQPQKLWCTKQSETTTCRHVWIHVLEEIVDMPGSYAIELVLQRSTHHECYKREDVRKVWCSYGKKEHVQPRMRVPTTPHIYHNVDHGPGHKQGSVKEVGKHEHHSGATTEA